jgi:hypothetical protein
MVIGNSEWLLLKNNEFAFITPSGNFGMIFIMPAFVQLSWKMWAVTAMKKRNKFACYRVVRAL